MADQRNQGGTVAEPDASSEAYETTDRDWEEAARLERYQRDVGSMTLDQDHAWACVDLVATDPSAIDSMKADMGDNGDQVVPYLVHALCVEVGRQRQEVETFVNATRVLGAMVHGLMGQEMADDVDELLAKLHAAGQRERARFLAPDERFTSLVVDVAEALVTAAQKAAGR